jgi:integrase
LSDSVSHFLGAVNLLLSGEWRLNSRSERVLEPWKLFRQARDKAGLPADLVLYCGRHDYGTRVMRKTGNLAAVMKTMGHKDVRTAMRYQHPELDIVRNALNATQSVMVQ